MTHSPENNEILKRIMQREQEQLLLQSICESLAMTENRAEFHRVVNSELKSKLEFEHFCIFLYQEAKEGYVLFYSSESSKSLQFKDEVIKTDFFDRVLNSPDPVLIPKPEIIKTGLQFIVGEGYKNTIKKTLFCNVPSKRFQVVLCLGYSKDGKPEREDLRLVRQLCSQLNITLTNILLLEKYIPLHGQSNQVTQDEKIHIPAHDMGIVGSSEPMQQVRNLISMVSESDTGVIILGESGTGKELVAKAIHENSGRKNKKLIKINCAAIPENLLESELFGHEKGSFTGAVSQKKGKFEMAHNGTLFLDEIGELPIELQVKLLRALQEKEIERIGGHKTIAVNVRIIAATNRDLQQEITKGNFRADLYYRLNIFPIYIPSLKERIEDVKVLAQFFVQRFCVKNKQKIKTISAKAMRTLEMHSWPGNVRELEHAIERAVLLSPEKTIKEIAVSSYNDKTYTTADNTVIKSWREFEKDYLLSVLKFCNGRISGDNGAAALLDLPPTTLKSRMERLGIKKRHYLS
ncbi:sigma-54 dependent transcriptional regulator [Flavobacterium rakeshii]|uniref:sigma-54 interaction domain-containing protein n=1 Tax=Flavobacterium rakeshii TaxID=1038845 RepID=UPI002E7ABC48|nr:sigma-54 dependent transcriptional regulator [Flavobacterium rakeshii]MEE1898424.1 sigma-54 dependent transcriptional regulator [Flavobacterium rakeshii]